MKLFTILLAVLPAALAVAVADPAPQGGICCNYCQKGSQCAKNCVICTNVCCSNCETGSECTKKCDSGC
ncbi:unnamed protein product [Zymoseptoria tritici ST99CH_1A5]|uniref:4Fe-4S ferredoxin-type domain-containing protein n=3 Tax=Zymoseptoria tritici TaxID=1047171 RepID=A0A1X7S5C1_ZYMT9|nr:unnamed protein product [Zymoseptoria tritici ST99CH_3D7]SMR59150.1 unnamed protein product [Zymoseptoria tritici ST99CH_1E4]SMY28359.1 unnamed protein product [Zymoseptoria tritici ST99CH_1A5]